jgi:hypothetical protein
MQQKEELTYIHVLSETRLCDPSARAIKVNTMASVIDACTLNPALKVSAIQLPPEDSAA